MSIKNSAFYKQEEIDFLHSTDSILLKRKLLERIEKQMYNAAKSVSELKAFENLKKKFPELSDIPKVNRGENLRGLPFRILDYPVFFSKENILAFRLLFWWGQPLRSILHLKGNYLLQINKKALLQVQDSPLEYKFRNTGKEWDYDFKASIDINFQHLEKFNFLQIWAEHPLSKLEELETILPEHFKTCQKLFC